MKTRKQNLNKFVKEYEDEITGALIMLITLAAMFLILNTFFSNPTSQNYYCSEYDEQARQCLTFEQTIKTMELPFDIYEGEKGSKLKLKLELFYYPLDIVENKIMVQNLYMNDEDEIIFNSNYDNVIIAIDKIKETYPELEIVTTSQKIHYINKFQFYGKRYIEFMTFKSADNILTFMTIGLLYLTSMFITYLINRYRNKQNKWRTSTWQNFITICKSCLSNLFTCALVIIVLSLPYYLSLYNSHLFFVGLAILILLAMFGYAEYKART